MSYLRLLWLSFRIGALNDLAYRANFVVAIIQSLVGLGLALGGLAMVFSHTDTLGGWQPDELLALVGIYFIIGGTTNFVIQPSMVRFMEDVRLGTLDFTLTKPEDAQLLVSVRQVQVWKLADVALGLAVLAVALTRLGADLGVGQTLVFLSTLAAGAATVYSVILMLATLSFWFVRVENILVIFNSMYEAGRWPVGIYPPWLRSTLTFLVPVAVAVTVPAEALADRLGAWTLAGAVTLELALLAGSRWFWRFGLRHYAGASA